MTNELYELINEMNKVFSNKEVGFQSFPIDVKKEENGYEMSCEIPGVKKENINITLENNELTIIAKKDDKNEAKYLVKERNTLGYKRSLQFQEDIENVTGKYENGILTISIMLKKPEAKEKRTISIM